MTWGFWSNAVSAHSSFLRVLGVENNSTILRVCSSTSQFITCILATYREKSEIETRLFNWSPTLNNMDWCNQSINQSIDLLICSCNVCWNVTTMETTKKTNGCFSFWDGKTSKRLTWNILVELNRLYQLFTSSLQRSFLFNTRRSIFLNFDNISSGE